jgi:hypothetical protein
LTAHLAARSAKAIVWARSTSVNEGPRCQRSSLSKGDMYLWYVSPF